MQISMLTPSHLFFRSPYPFLFVPLSLFPIALNLGPLFLDHKVKEKAPLESRCCCGEQCVEANFNQHLECCERVSAFPSIVFEYGHSLPALPSILRLSRSTHQESNHGVQLADRNAAPTYVSIESSTTNVHHTMNITTAMYNPKVPTSHIAPTPDHNLPQPPHASVFQQIDTPIT